MLLPIRPSAVNLKRCFSCSIALKGRRSRVPYDKRNFPTTDRDIGENTERTNKEWNKQFAEQYRRDAWKYGLGPQPQGYYKPDGTLVKVPEMIPEFIVPDLSDCKLKPYVPYNAEEIHQSEFTARDLFDATYGAHVSQLYKERKVNVEDVPNVMDDYKTDSVDKEKS